MTISDLYGGTSLAPDQHLTPFSHSGTTSYGCKISKGEQFVLDVQNASTLSIQLSGKPEALILEVSNQDYRRPATPTSSNYRTTPIANAIPNSEFDAPWGAFTWTKIASPATTFEKLDVTSISQIRFTTEDGMLIHLELDPTPSPAVTWLPNASAPTVGASLQDVIDAINAAQDAEFTLVQNDGTTDYYYAQWVAAADGSGMTLAYFDMNGAPVAAPANPVPVQSVDYETTQTCYEVTTAGTGYAVGEHLIRVSFYNSRTQTLLGEVFRNETTGAVVVPVMSDLARCGANDAYITQQPLFDYDADGVRRQFLRTFVVDADGFTQSTVDTETDGVTAFSISTGGQQTHSPVRHTLGHERIKFSDSGVNQFGNIPAGATYAEYHIWGGNCVIATAGFTPADSVGEGIRLQDGASPELESTDEIKGFQVIGQAGQSGIIYVEYFNHR